MPTTRSASRGASAVAQNATVEEKKPTPRAPKRKASTVPSTSATKEKRTRVAKAPPELLSAATRAQIEDFQRNLPESGPAPELVPAQLPFSLEEAKKELSKADPRFQILFERVSCKPFEQLETVHPFRALVTSIVGQQISWIAARAVNHKFVRLFNPSLPEKVTDYQERSSAISFFPTPQQVANTDLTLLRAAGLSARKAEYGESASWLSFISVHIMSYQVRDLASRFADGRLSTEKLLKAGDDELAEMLIEVKGIGRWTVDMFSIFTLRRPNILPVGDLGVQRGMLRWFLGLHSATYSCSISPDKADRNTLVEDGSYAEDNTLPSLVDRPASSEKDMDSTQSTPFDLSSIPPAPPATPMIANGTKTSAPFIPPPMTPSVEQALLKVEKSPGYVPLPLPEGLSASVLQSRLDGKKKIKGALLTPNEMEALSASWQPYRSIGVYYMWALEK